MDNNIKAVIFDLDGTLIDTEKHYRVAWPKACAKFGFNMTDEQALEIRSLGQPFSVAKFAEWFGPEFDYQEVKKYRIQLMNEILSEKGIELKAGAVEILNYLKEKGYMIAVATANPYERTEKFLKEVGLFDYFDKIICATMVKEGKPSPDVYLYACKQLELAPSECIAVEDSPNGVNSAYSAGCKVVMVPDQDQPDDELIKHIFMKADTLLSIKEILY